MLDKLSGKITSYGIKITVQQVVRKEIMTFDLFTKKGVEL